MSTRRQTPSTVLSEATSDDGGAGARKGDVFLNNFARAARNAAPQRVRGWPFAGIIVRGCAPCDFCTRAGLRSYGLPQIKLEAVRRSGCRSVAVGLRAVF